MQQRTRDLASLEYLQVQFPLKFFSNSHQMIAFELIAETKTRQFQLSSISTFLQPIAQLAHVFYLIATKNERDINKRNPEETLGSVL